MLAMRLPAKVAAASTVQVVPPSVERATPKPGLPLKLKELVLPVPANRVLESTGHRQRVDRQRRQLDIGQRRPGRGGSGRIGSLPHAAVDGADKNDVGRNGDNRVDCSLP